MFKEKIINGEPYYIVNVNAYKNRLMPTMSLLRRAKVRYLTINDKGTHFIFAKVNMKGDRQMALFDFERKLCKAAGIVRVNGLIYGFDKDFEWNKGEDLYAGKIRYGAEAHVLFYTKEQPTKEQAQDAATIYEVMDSMRLIYRV